EDLGVAAQPAGRAEPLRVQPTAPVVVLPAGAADPHGAQRATRRRRASPCRGPRQAAQRRGRGSPDVSTASKSLPFTRCSVWRSSLFQPREGAPVTYQGAPLSATIIP